MVIEKSRKKIYSEGRFAGGHPLDHESPVHPCRGEDKTHVVAKIRTKLTDRMMGLLKSVK